MIRIILLGGTGNHLFQYALGRYLAIKHDTGLILDQYRLGRGYNRRYELGRFEIAARAVDAPVSTSDAARMRHEQSLQATGIPIFTSQGQRFDSRVLSLPAPCILFGLFQSEKYFRPVADTIRKELAFKPYPIAEETAALTREIESTTSVSVHVRRGDYVVRPQFSVCTMDYYRRAIEYVRGAVPAPTFYFFSDDIGWCRDRFAGPDFVFCNLDQSASDPLNDMRLMSICRHHIIANSTFSWWGAWLNDDPHKVVVAPDRWQHAEDVPIDDKLCDRWVRIPVEVAG